VRAATVLEGEIALVNTAAAELEQLAR